MTEVVIRSSRPTPLRELLSPPGAVASLARYRELILQFALRDVAARHKGTSLGLAWMIINPLLTLAVYTFVFTQIFESRWERIGAVGGTTEFVLTFFAGFVVYSIFSEVATRAPTLVLEKPNLVRKVVFPLEIIPVSTLLSSLIFGAVGLALLVLAVPVFTGTVSSTIYLFPVVLVPLCALGLGAAWLLAALGVYIRDLKNVMAVVMQLLFFITPIFYAPEAVPEPYRQILYINPLTTIIQNARKTLLWGEMPDWVGLGVVTLVSVVVLQAGYAFFMGTKRGFADVI